MFIFFSDFASITTPTIAAKRSTEAISKGSKKSVNKTFPKFLTLPIVESGLDVTLN